MQPENVAAKGGRRPIPQWLVALSVTGFVLVFGAAVCGYWLYFHGGDGKATPGEIDLRATYIPAPEGENGFALISAAGRMTRLPEEQAAEDENIDSAENDWDVFWKMMEGKIWDSDLAHKVLEANRLVFEVFEQGLERPHFQVPRIESSDSPMEYLADFNELSHLLKLKGFARFEEKKEQEGFDTALDLVRFGQALEDASGMALHYLMGITVKATACDLIRKLLPRTSLQPAALLPYVGELRKRGPSERGMAYALRLECEIFAREVDAVALGTMNIWEFLDQPPPEDPSKGRGDILPKTPYFLSTDETKRLAEKATRVLLRDLMKPEAEREKIGHGYFGETADELSLKSNSVGRTLCQIRFSELNFKLRQRALEEADISTTRLLLALKCFKVETGSLPPSLDALVPKYIDAVPRDPFDGKPFRYSPEKKIVYSVGRDLVDDGGAEGEDRSSNENELTYAIEV